MNKAWFLDDSECEECGSEVVVSVFTSGDGDYQYYCSNPLCKHHEGESLGDMENPTWIKDIKKS